MGPYDVPERAPPTPTELVSLPTRATIRVPAFGIWHCEPPRRFALPLPLCSPLPVRSARLPAGSAPKSRRPGFARCRTVRRFSSAIPLDAGPLSRSALPAPKNRRRLGNRRPASRGHRAGSCHPVAALATGSEEPMLPASAERPSPRHLGRNPSPPARRTACAAPRLGPTTARRPEDRPTAIWQRIPDRRPAFATVPSRAPKRKARFVEPARDVRKRPAPVRIVPRRARRHLPTHQLVSARNPLSVPPTLRGGRLAPVRWFHLGETLASFGPFPPPRKRVGPEIGRSARGERAVPHRKPKGPEAIPLPTGAISRRRMSHGPRRSLAPPVAFDAPTLTRAQTVCRMPERKQEKTT